VELQTRDVRLLLGHLGIGFGFWPAMSMMLPKLIARDTAGPTLQPDFGKAPPLSKFYLSRITAFGLIPRLHD
jgi:hypothetical protein